MVSRENPCRNSYGLRSRYFRCEPERARQRESKCE